jgi:hypothetical protein
MKHLIRAWNRWKLSVARDELEAFQSRFDVQPQYLCNVMRHIADLEHSLEKA